MGLSEGSDQGETTYYRDIDEIGATRSARRWCSSSFFVNNVLLTTDDAMTFAGTPDDRARIVPPASDTKLSLPPMGGTVSLVVSSIIAGAAAAKLLHDTTPVGAWLTAAGLCGGIFGLTKLLVRGRPTGMRLLGLLALGCLTFSYLLVLGGESTPRPVRRDALGLLALLTVLLGVLAAATALPLLLIAAALRRDRNAKVPHVSFPASPILITLALGTGTLVVGFVLLAVTIWMVPARWRIPAILIVGLASPVLLLPLWAYTYQRLLSRWQVRHRSPSLSQGLEMLSVRTGFVFDRILCLDERFGGGSVCQVVALPRRSTLVISESIASALTAEQLLAVLAHEAAHVSLDHVWRKLAWGALGSVVALATAVVGQELIAPLVPRSLGLVGILAVLLPIGILRGLYDTFVIRRHEAEADEFAVDVAGTRALLSALEALRASGQSAVLVHNRWTTHGTWEVRAAKIRAYGDSRACP